MSMKRIVFFGAAILVTVIIIAWVLHSMTHIDEINQKRREKNQGQALASQMIATTATTSIWDALRVSETAETQTGENPENQNDSQNLENPEEQQATASPEEMQEENSLTEENTPIPQTFTETVE